MNISLSACQEDLKSDYEAPVDQAVLFEYRYVNFAWGYAENGWLIDSEGNMRSFSLPENFRLPDSTGYISQEDLDAFVDAMSTVLVNRYAAGLLQFNSQNQVEVLPMKGKNTEKLTRVRTRLKLENVPAINSTSYDYYVNFTVSLNLFNGGNTRLLVGAVDYRPR